MVKVKKDISLKGIIIFVSFLVVCLLVVFVVSRITTKQPRETADVDAAITDISEMVDGIADVIEGSEGTVAVVDTKATLTEIVTINQLHSLSYTYNSICSVKDSGKVVYHVRYEGTVVLGIDANDISIYVDDNANKVVIRLPEVVVQSTAVDATSLRYIFVDNTYDNDSTGVTAQSKCEEDLLDKIEDEELMFELARENTITEVEAMFQPIISQSFPEYTLDVDFD